jgi:hypothetical protein
MKRTAGGVKDARDKTNTKIEIGSGGELEAQKTQHERKTTKV